MEESIPYLFNSDNQIFQAVKQMMEEKEREGLFFIIPDHQLTYLLMCIQKYIRRDTLGPENLWEYNKSDLWKPEKKFLLVYLIKHEEEKKPGDVIPKSSLKNLIFNDLTTYLIPQIITDFFTPKYTYAQIHDDPKLYMLVEEVPIKPFMEIIKNISQKELPIPENLLLLESQNPTTIESLIDAYLKKFGDDRKIEMRKLTIQPIVQSSKSHDEKSEVGSNFVL